MASVEESATGTVNPGPNPDSVTTPPRVWQFAPIRQRNPAPPDYSNAGLDIRRHGDPLSDATAVTSLILPNDTIRNGLKRSNNSNGQATLWAEPSPRSYDTAGTVSGTLGVVAGPAGAADNEVALGVQASHSVSHPGGSDFPLIVRPIGFVWGARFESNQATLQGLIETDHAGTVTNYVRDLSYAYGGAFTIPWPAVTVLAGQTYSWELDLQLVYREAIASAFEVQVAGAQVLFQFVEYTSQS